MIKHKNPSLFGALSVLLGCLLAGCQSEAPLNSTNLDKPEILASTPAPTPAATPLIIINPKQTVQVDKEDLTISSVDSEESTKEKDRPGATEGILRPADEAANVPGPSPLPDYNVRVPYDANNPTLMGFTILDSLASVSLRFGEPVHKYSLDDDLDVLTVYEYPGFEIGFTASKEIKFIHVISNAMDPGLNGLRLGQTVDKAIKALGIPNDRSAFVLNYWSNGVVLKLDVDPEIGFHPFHKII